MTDTFLDLDALPAPDVIEALSFEQLFQRKLATLVAIDPAFSALLESDPAIKLLEADSYDELILRQRINDAARARLLAFAAGGDLDQLAAYYGVARQTGEGDIAFKARVRLAIMSRSAAGTAAQYRFAALSASIDVLDVNVDSPQGGVVRVSIISSIGDGTPTQELMDTVRGVVMATNVKALCHTVLVVPAEIVTVDITASVWLTETAPAAVFDGLPGLLADKFAAVRALGYNVATSWIISTLQQPGVQRVEVSSPASQVVIAPNQCADLGAINLTLAGRDA